MKLKDISLWAREAYSAPPPPSQTNFLKEIWLDIDRHLSQKLTILYTAPPRLTVTFRASGFPPLQLCPARQKKTEQIR